MGSTAAATESDVHHTSPARVGRGLVRIASVLVVMIATAAIGLTVAAAPAGASGGVISGIGAPLPPNAGPPASVLVSTSCPAAGNCVAVGAYESGGSATGLIETLSGGNWSAAEAPAIPGGTDEELLAVSCSSVGNCGATGAYESGGNHFGLLLTESAGTWTATAAPLPPGAAADPDVELLSISCPAAGSCAAVGIYEDTSAEEVSVLLTLSGGTWTATAAPVPPGAVSPTHDEAIGVSCGAPGSCEAVGEYSGTGEIGLLLSLSGGTWQATQAPLPGGFMSAESAIFSVSCPAAGNCTAAGAYENSGGSTVPVAEVISGGSANPTSMPLPSNASTASGSGAIPFQIDCPSASYCAAVGGYDSTAGSGVAPLIDILSGGSWTASEAPGTFDPSNHTILSGVSCSWPGSCSAVGISSSSSPTASTGVIETLSDGTWSESSTVTPSGSSPPQVMLGLGLDLTLGTPVSCSGGTCAFTGSYLTTADLESGFLNLSPSLSGYQLVAADGGIFAFNAPFYGSMGGQHLNQPIVGVAVVPDSGGYYEVASDGGIFAFNAPFYGSMGGQHLNKPIVGIAFDTLTGGYYEVASDGGIFAFNAPFYGSMGSQHLNKPIVGIAFDPATGGYYEVASDGGIFAFNAPFQGSTGSLVLNKPVVGMAVDVATGGYYEVASDGGIFAWDAPFQGSTGSLVLAKPVVGMAYDYVSGGYYLAASDGGIFAFNAPFQQSLGGQHLNAPVVGMGFG